MNLMHPYESKYLFKHFAQWCVCIDIHSTATLLSSMKLQTQSLHLQYPESRILRPLVFRDSTFYQIVSDKHVKNVKNLSRNVSIVNFI